MKGEQLKASKIVKLEKGHESKEYGHPCSEIW